MSKWVAGMCNEKSGFLFSHVCDRFSQGECTRCSKPVCFEHQHETPEGSICTTCKKKGVQRGKYRSSQDTEYDEDPYFYGGSYYRGYGYYHTGMWGHDHYSDAYGHDPHDFTEADAESLMQAGNEEFESDMMES